MKGLSLLRFLISIAILILLGMLYWSSQLREQDLKQIYVEIQDLKKELEGMQLDGKRLRHELKQSSLQPKGHVETTLMDPAYPNLLSDDPYFTKTLPEMLGDDFRPSGTRRQALLGHPEHLHPFNAFRDVSNMMNMCNVSVAQLQFGKYDTLAPSMAIKMEQRPRPDQPSAHEYWVHLRDGVYWEPLKQRHFPDEFELASHFTDERHQVTAHDFKFFYDAVMNPYVSEPKAASLRNYFNDIESIRVIDNLTFVVRWKIHSVDGEPKVKYTAESLTGSLQPLASFVFKYFSDGQKILDDDTDPETYRKNSVWAQNFSQHWAKNVIVSCGPWLFDGMNDEGIKFKRNNNFYQPYAVLVERLRYTFKESVDAIWQDFKAGNVDMATLAPSQLAELNSFLKSPMYKEQEAKGEGIRELDFVDQAYYYLGWNQKTAYFGDEKVRQALTMAIDRNRIIQQNLNDMGVAVTGPFFRYSPAYDPTLEAWPYNPHEARRLLDEEGWVDMDGDGIRDKIIGGKRVPFRFTLIYYAKNVSTKVICEYIATSLKEIGVDCQLNGLDITDLSRSFEDKAFDAIYLGWSMGTPPEDPRQLWHSSGANEKGSSNAIGYNNPAIDQLIDRLSYEDDRKKRVSLYHKFHKIIHEEQPYTFLYSPKTRLLYRNYVKNLFIPRHRQDLVPGADISEPDYRVIYLESHD